MLFLQPNERNNIFLSYIFKLPETIEWIFGIDNYLAQQFTVENWVFELFQPVHEQHRQHSKASLGLQRPPARLSVTQTQFVLTHSSPL